MRKAKYYEKSKGIEMYPYHNRIRQRIKNGELVRIEKGTDEFAFVFIFCTPPHKRPIRPHSVWRYEDIISFEKLKVFRNKNEQT